MYLLCGLDFLLFVRIVLHPDDLRLVKAFPLLDEPLIAALEPKWQRAARTVAVFRNLDNAQLVGGKRE